jgi:hypothetical protein
MPTLVLRNSCPEIYTRYLHQTARSLPAVDWEELATEIDTARAELDLTQDQLWLEYHLKGGRVGRSAFINYLQARSEPRVTDYDVLAETVNALLGARGVKRRLPRLTN